MSDQSVPTEDFLSAEQAAQQLAQSLKRLDAEAESYSTAGKTLEQVSTGVRELASRTSVVAERTAEAVEAIRSIGSVQILEQVQALSAGAEANTDAVREISTKLDTISGQVDAIGVVAKTLDSKIDGIVQALGRSAETAKAGSDAMMKLAKNAMYAAIAAAVLAALAAILTRF